MVHFFVMQCFCIRSQGKYGACGIANDTFCCTSQEEPLGTTPAMAAHDNEVNVMLLCVVQDGIAGGAVGSIRLYNQVMVRIREINRLFFCGYGIRIVCFQIIQQMIQRGIHIFLANSRVKGMYFGIYQGGYFGSMCKCSFSAI